MNSTQRQTSARLHLRGSKGRLGQSRDPGDFLLLFFTIRLSGSEAYRGYISTSSSVYTGGRANQGTSISAVALGDRGTTWLSANFISIIWLSPDSSVEVWTNDSCAVCPVRESERDWCSPTGAAGRWKDVPEERMWQQEVLILQPHSATPCKKSGRKSTPAAEEIHRKSAEEILCVSTGNPYKVSLANLPDILRHHHAHQIIQDNLSRL